MKLETILFPTDFSRPSCAALDYATLLAAETGATMLIAHIEPPAVEPAHPELTAETAHLIGPQGAEAAEFLRSITPTNRQVAHQYRLLQGDPAAELVRLAHERQVDLIVMGTHGRTGLTRFLLGSVAEKIVRSAPCPVLTLRIPDYDRVLHGRLDAGS